MAADADAGDAEVDGFADTVENLVGRASSAPPRARGAASPPSLTVTWPPSAPDGLPSLSALHRRQARHKQPPGNARSGGVGASASAGSSLPRRLRLPSVPRAAEADADDARLAALLEAWDDDDNGAKGSARRRPAPLSPEADAEFRRDVAALSALSGARSPFGDSGGGRGGASASTEEERSLADTLEALMREVAGDGSGQARSDTQRAVVGQPSAGASQDEPLPPLTRAQQQLTLRSAAQSGSAASADGGRGDRDVEGDEAEDGEPLDSATFAAVCAALNIDQFNLTPVALGLVPPEIEAVLPVRPRTRGSDHGGPLGRGRRGGAGGDDGVEDDDAEAEAAGEEAEAIVEGMWSAALGDAGELVEALGAGIPTHDPSTGRMLSSRQRRGIAVARSMLCYLPRHAPRKGSAAAAPALAAAAAGDAVDWTLYAGRGLTLTAVLAASGLRPDDVLELPAQRVRAAIAAGLARIAARTHTATR